MAAKRSERAQKKGTENPSNGTKGPRCSGPPLTKDSKPAVVMPTLMETAKEKGDNLTQPQDDTSEIEKKSDNVPDHQTEDAQE